MSKRDQLNLDEIMNDQSSQMQSLAALSIKAGVEDEKCLVTQYRTTPEQKNIFRDHLATCPKNKIPIEWVIDIADESNGWFYGTAYHFDDTIQMLHVMVPDKVSPSFDGQVLLDYRTVHLIECVDGKSDALFNKIVRDSIVKVKWDVEWFEEETPGSGAADDAKGNWIPSSARYLIRIANQVLVEDTESEDGTKGFVMLTADLNLRLLKCSRGKGAEDFNRLVVEGIVQSSPEAMESARSDLNVGESYDTRGGDSTASSAPTIRKLADNARNLRECVYDLLEDRESTSQDMLKLAQGFKQFALEGDLDRGLELIEQAREIEENKQKATKKAHAAENADASDGEKGDDPMDQVADEAWKLVNKMEKGVVRLLKSSSTVSGGAAGDSEELESLRKSQKKLKKDLEDKDRELQILRNKAGH